MNCRNLVFLTVVVFLYSGLARTGFAQDMVDQFDKEMPEIVLPDNNDFMDNSSLVNDKTQEDKALYYSISVPRTWDQDGNIVLDDVSVNSKITGTLRKFYGPPSFTERSKLLVEASSPTYDITAKQWMLQYLLTNGYNLQGIKEYNENKVEAIYVLIEDTETYVVRSVAIANGKHILFASYYLPMERWEEEKLEQVQVIRSFKVDEEIEEYVEEMSQYQFLDLATFEYPVSWRMRTSPIISVDRMSVDLLRTVVVRSDYEKEQKRIDGQIEISLVSIYATEDPEDEILRFNAGLGKKGLKIGALIESEEMEPRQHFDFESLFVYKAVSNGKRVDDHEFWIKMMSAGDYYYYYTLLTPSRNSKYFTWAQNAEAFKLVTSLTNPQVGGVGNQKINTNLVKGEAYKDKPQDQNQAE